MIKVKCMVCNKEHEIKEWRLKNYRTCSRKCLSEYTKSKTIKHFNKCEVCGNDYQVKKSHKSKRKTCSRLCGAKYKSIIYSNEGNPMYGIRGENSKHWKGGNRNSNYGYKMIYDDDIENKSRKSDRYHLEHRFIMSRHIGRPLKKEELVHHRNGIKTDNSIENLEITCIRDHSSHHYKDRIVTRDKITGMFISNKPKQYKD